MTENELKLRPGKFEVAVLHFIDQLSNRKRANIIGTQFGRSASSVAANYCAACRSHAEFVAKLGGQKKWLSNLFSGWI